VDALTDDKVRLLVLDKLEAGGQVTDLLLDRGCLVVVAEVEDTVDVEAEKGKLSGIVSLRLRLT
jgi:hypothetical protein